jgi:hypothetical protein
VSGIYGSGRDKQKRSLTLKRDERNLNYLERKEVDMYGQRSYVESDGRGGYVQIPIYTQMDVNAQAVIQMIEENEALKAELQQYNPISRHMVDILKLKFFSLLPFGVNSVNWEKVVQHLLSEATG